MPYSVNHKGTISGVNTSAGESVLELDIAALLEGTDYAVGTDLSVQANLDAAVAMPSVTIVNYYAGNAAQPIENFQAAGGYNDDWSVATGGRPTGTFTMAVRVKEKHSDNSVVVGPWCKGSRFTVPIAVAEFTGSSVDSGFSSRLYGSGTVTVSGGSASISAPSATDAAVVRYDSALPTNKVFTITVKGQGNGADVTNMDFIGILQQAAAPAPTGTNDATVGAAARLTMVFRPGSGYLMQYQDTGGNWQRWLGSSWGAGAFIAGPVSGTQYVYQLQSNGTQFRMTLFAADGTTVITQSSWVNWSSVKNDSNPLWLYVGDMNTEWNTCSMAVDYIRIS